MIDRIIERVLNENNIKEAFQSFSHKENGHGKDGVYMKDVLDYYDLNKEKIVKSIYDKTYQCQTVLLQEMLDYKGKRRIIALMASIDRLLSRALYQILYTEIDSLFSPYSYAYRENKGTKKAVEQAFAYIKDNHFVCAIDIENFFDEIDHDILLKEIKKIINDNVAISLIESFMKCEIEYDYMLSLKHKGLIQGNPISPLLSNIYLNSLDEHLQKKEMKFVRFCDNIYIFSDDKTIAYQHLNHVKQILQSRYHLNINKRKSGVFKATDIQYLGYQIKKKNKNLEIVKYNRKYEKYNYSWYTSSLRFINHQYHLIDDGILRKKDFHLLFENEKQKVQIPIEVVDHINVYSNIIFSSSFFNMMNEKKLIVNVHDNMGNYIGSFIPKNIKSGTSTLLNQAHLYTINDERLKIIKKMLNATIHNERANIKYYQKHIKDDLSSFINQLTEYLKDVNECQKYEDLLLIEARAKQVYYQTFHFFIENKDFHFEKRSKQPPLDNINALISFGNTVLYNLIANEIYKTSLDIRIGYLHASNNRKQSLNLDIADIFKPIIIDRCIFSMINKKMINHTHFENKNNGVYLSDEGKRIFLQQIRQKLSSHIQQNHQNVTYSTVIRNNLYMLIKYINKEEKLKFYKYQ